MRPADLLGDDLPGPQRRTPPGQHRGASFAPRGDPFRMLSRPAYRRGVSVPTISERPEYLAGPAALGEGRERHRSAGYVDAHRPLPRA